MSLLMRNSTVTTRSGGGFVESIDGLSGGREGSDAVDWLYYVNGVQAPRGAAETVVHHGDRIWWDLHDWSQTEEVPAVVGSFPQPFSSGIEGKRLPVRIECLLPASASCGMALRRLRSVGVRAATAAPSSAGEGSSAAPAASPGPGEETSAAPAASPGLGEGTSAAPAALPGAGGRPTALRVLVGPFAAIAAREPAVRQLEQGPRASGVYARFYPDGRALTVLDARGRTMGTLGAGTGLVAATRSGQGPPVWLITGTDTAGVDLAARALTEARLRDRFALALTARDAAVPLPGGRE
jgi:hypothetical protein